MSALNRNDFGRDEMGMLSNSGVNKLNDETQMLAENPLVREISLIVAKELLK